MKAEDYFSDEKTIYTITDEHGERSSITVDKWIGDLLQISIPDVHAWVQERYEYVLKRVPNRSRRERGNAVRELARREAEKSESYIPITHFLGFEK